MHIEPQPMTSAVHVVRAIESLLDGCIEVAFDNPLIDQPLGQHLDRGVMPGVKRQTWCRVCHRRLLRGEHDVVECSLLGGEAPAGRKRACDVRGVAMQLAAGVYQHQIVGANDTGARGMMQGAGIAARGHNGFVGRSLRAITQKYR